MKNIFKIFSKVAFCAVVAGSFAVSCDNYEYDDTEIKEQIEMIITKLYDLEQRMNSEIDALKDMMSGKIMITDVQTDVNTGITVVTLTNGSKLQLLPEKDLESFVTYITSGGVNYWAYIDENGKKQYFLDENGEAIPVMPEEVEMPEIPEMPEVITRDGENFLVIGGVEYPLAGNSLFSDYELIKDELTGDVLAVTFTFGDEMTFTVTVDGAASFLFVRNNGTTSTVLKEYYVSPGEKTKVQIQVMGVADYVLQIPDGWRVKEGEDALLGRYFEITAPGPSLIESGVAVADGDLKVVAVLEGGKALVSKLYLTTEPFNEVVVAAGNATVKMKTGLVKYVYGVCDENVYDEATVYATAESLLESVSDYPAGYGIATNDLEGVSLAQIAGGELLPGVDYIFWVIPVAYSEKDAAFYIQPETMQTIISTYGSVSFEIKDVAFRDAAMDMKLEGATAYYFNLVAKADYNQADVISILNSAPETFVAKTEPMTYSGSVFSFAGATAVENTEYVAWLVMKNDTRPYVDADLIVREFKTLDLVPGSTVAITAEEKEITYDNVTVTLTASGAEKIYYLYMKASDLPTFATEEEKAKYVMENGKLVVADNAEAKASDCIQEIAPETDLKLLTLVTDATGKYSAVLEKDYKTAVMPVRELKVNLSVAKNAPEEIKVNISTEGAENVSYIYWIGKADSNVWTSKNILGGSAETAKAYMVANPTHSRFVNAATNYPIVDEVITIKGHTVNQKYIVVAVAQDDSGSYSDATVLEFLAHPVNLGNIVPKSADAWKAAEAALRVEFIQQSFRSGGEFSTYSYNVTAPQNFTAYVISGSISTFNEGDESVVAAEEEKMCHIIVEADRKRDTERYIKDGEDLYYTFEHGDPSDGNVVIWADIAFHDEHCRREGCEGSRDVEGTRYGNPGIIHHVVYYNDGNPVKVTNPYAAGNVNKTVDQVFVVLQDIDGNCYEPFVFNAPFEYFAANSEGGGFGVDSE